MRATARPPVRFIAGSAALLWVYGIFWSALSEPVLRAQDPKPQGDEDAYKTKALPLIQKYCYKCHGTQGKPEGNFSIAKYQTEKAVLENRDVFKKILHKLQIREMPPEDKPQPSAEERELLTRTLEAALNRIDASAKRNPGRVVPRRLNRNEYRNTIRDLLGVDFNPNSDFPSDDIGYGFDNIGDVLSLPPLLMEKYIEAGKKIAGEAIAGKDKEKFIFVTTLEKEKTKRDAARAILTRLASRAYRRPAAADEIDRLLKLYDAAEKQEPSFEAAIKLPLRAILISPHFLFRSEQENAATDADGAYLIGEYELATRLSYFLWASMPDEELFEEAKKGTLRKNLQAQVSRMLRNPKAGELSEDFAPQWLQVRRLARKKFDPGKFPDFDDELRQAMVREVVLFFDSIVKEDRSVLDFIDADFTYVNERLAKHYGIDGVSGDEFKRVKLPDRRRGGILTMAAILAATSDPNRTSPVKRGKWVLESILGIEPPPPIPSAANLKDDGDSSKLTLRQRMEKHRKDPNCASCHAKMDPIGFGFENFDATGAWRDRDGSFELDTAATLPDGKSFKGPIELKDILKARKAEFVSCLVEKLLTYGLGRGVEYYDAVAVKQIGETAAKAEYRFSGVVLEIVKSYPFQYRQKGRK